MSLRALTATAVVVLAVAGCGGQHAPERTPLPPRLVSATPVRDADGAQLDQAAEAWKACYRDHGSRGQFQECADEYASAAAAGQAVLNTIRGLPNRAGYRKVADAMSSFVARHQRFATDGCEAGFPPQFEPCSGHLNAMAVEWTEANSAIFEIEPAG